MRAKEFEPYIHVMPTKQTFQLSSLHGVAFLSGSNIQKGEHSSPRERLLSNNPPPLTTS